MVKLITIRENPLSSSEVSKLGGRSGTISGAQLHPRNINDSANMIMLPAVICGEICCLNLLFAEKLS